MCLNVCQRLPLDWPEREIYDCVTEQNQYKERVAASELNQLLKNIV